MSISTTTTIVSYVSSSFLTNCPFLSALITFALAQSTKFFTSWYWEKHWDLKQLVGSGGMPSSHSSTVTALATAVGLQEGFGGSLFATSLVLACVVMYDATVVRLHAGRQAEVLNQIVCELPDEHRLAESIPLHKLLGHTPLRSSKNGTLKKGYYAPKMQVVAGGFLGLVTATIVWLITGSGYRA